MSCVSRAQNRDICTDRKRLHNPTKQEKLLDAPDKEKSGTRKTHGHLQQANFWGQLFYLPF